ncbi:recombinase family protein [Amnibacterium kyonggiense]|nr:recombinase family protein [Amnibacterium kyonggiense]
MIIGVPMVASMTTWQSVRDGHPGVGHRCFGWKRDNTTLEPTEASAVRELFDLVLDRGARPRDLAEYLNELGLLTPFGNAWRPETATRMLLRPRNAGVVTVHGVELPDAVAFWAPIVTRDVLDAASDRLRPRDALTHTFARWLGTNIARCATCGAVVKASSTDEAPVYLCGLPVRERVPVLRHARADAATVDAAIRTEVVNIIGAESAEIANNEIRRIDLDVADLMEQRRELLQVPEDDALGVTFMDLKPRLAAVQRRLTALHRERADVQRRAAMLAVRTGDATTTAERFDALSIDSRRNLVAELLDIRVYPRGSTPAFTIERRVS